MKKLSNVDYISSDQNIDSVNTPGSTSYSRLPKQLPVKKLGQQYKNMAGYVKIADLARLNDFLVVDTNSDSDTENQELLVNLEFTYLNHNQITIDGTINQPVTVVCQRCLKPMVYEINTKISVVLIDILSRIDKNLADYEPIEIKITDLLDLYQVIEDEMILSLPPSVKHDVNDSAAMAECDNSKLISNYID